MSAIGLQGIGWNDNPYMSQRSLYNHHLKSDMFGNNTIIVRVHDMPWSNVKNVDENSLIIAFGVLCLPIFSSYLDIAFVKCTDHNVSSQWL